MIHERIGEFGAGLHRQRGHARSRPDVTDLAGEGRRQVIGGGTDDGEIDRRQRERRRIRAVTLLAIGRGGLNVLMDRRHRRHDRHVIEDVTVDARNGSRRNVIGRFRGFVEIPDIEARVAIRTIGTTRRCRGRMIGIRRQGRAIHHRHAVPLHPGFVASLASVRDAGVVHDRAGEGDEIRRRVTHLAGFSGREVGLRFARCVHVVVTARAIVVNAGVIVVGRGPWQRDQMARAAFRQCRDVIGPLADRLHAVVAGTAGTQHINMVKLRNRLPTVRRMAGLAVVRREDVIERLRRRPVASTRRVTGKAVFGRAFKNAADMTTLTRDRSVQPHELKPGRVVIKGAGGRRLRDKRDQEQGQKRPN